MTKVWTPINVGSLQLPHRLAIPRLHEMAVVSQTIKQCRRHLGVTEHI